MKQMFTTMVRGLLVVVCLAGAVFAQTTVSGVVKDAESGEPLIGVSVAVKGTTSGGITDESGNFNFSTNARTPFTVVISSVGYANKEILVQNATEATNLSVDLSQSVILADEVVVSASRRAEKITESPATVNVITAQDIANLPSFNPGELLARQKGVDFVRSGVLGTGINVRGFNNTFNAKNLQLNDGRFSTLIATGLPMGALTPVVKEDIERVEIVLGPSSALYGPNAGNGIVNTVTKDPRTSQGTTLAFGFGAQDVFSTRIRHAQTIGNRFAFKINGEYTRGTEFEYTDSVYVTGNALTANPNFDPGQAPSPLNNPTRGVAELDLDRTFEAIKGDVSLYYSIDDDKDIIFSYLGSNSSNLGVTNQGRNQIRDWQIHQFHLRYVSTNWFAQVYHTLSRTDSTFNLNQRTTNYWNLMRNATGDATEGGATITASEEASARANSFTNAVFTDDSERWNAELQYNNQFGNLTLIAGAQFQRDEGDSNGTYLLDTDGEIVVNQIGVYTQLEYKFGDSGLKAVASARGDNHDFYGFNFVPKGALLYIGDKGTWRLTYGLGIAAPTIINLEGRLFGGLILGNGEGFTLSDGTVINELKVEKTQTIELGYKGNPLKGLFIDANAYFNFSQDFISPLTNIVPTGLAGGPVVTLRGTEPITNFTALPGLVLTYLNFGKVNTWGVDLGFNYYINNYFNIGLNYSYFDYDLRTDDLANDSNRDGVVSETDLLLNTPKHKASIAFNANKGRFFGTVLARWVQEYDFFSGINIAAADNSNLLWDGYTTIVADAPHRRSYNYGPLGGFVNVDLGLGYRITDFFTASAQVSNLFDTEMRELVASPFIGRLWGFELKVNVPTKRK